MDTETEWKKTLEKPEEKPEVKDTIAQAREAAKALEEQNKIMAEQIKTLEGLRAEQILSGSTNTGGSTPQPTEEERKKALAMEFWKGTDIEKSIEKYG